jgi:group I intron endonuclease
MSDVFDRGPGVYCIKNKTNGMIYIGSTKNMKRRISQHLYCLSTGRRSNSLLTHDFAIFGADSFDFLILRRVDDVDGLREAEQEFIDNTPVDLRYNHLPSVSGRGGWRKRPAYIGEAVAAANRNRVWTDEMRTRHSELLKCITTDEQRERARRLGKSMAGKKVSDETKDKLKKINTGKRHSDDAKRKMSDAHKGRVFSDETKNKLSAALKGRVISEETKIKMRASAKRRCALKAEASVSNKEGPSNGE